MKLLLLFLLSLEYILVSGQVDTAAIRRTIPTSDEFFQHQKFWDNIYFRDQELLSSPEHERINEENLVAVSMYFNRFGYPDYQRLGKRSKIIEMVWVHTSSIAFKLIAVPIMIRCFTSGANTEMEYREYFLRILYQNFYDDKGNMTLPLDSVYQRLNISDSDTISIPGLIKAFDYYHVQKSSIKDLVGEWWTAPRSKDYYLNGDTIKVNFDQTRITISKTRDDNYYMHLYSKKGNIMEPSELALKAGSPLQYKETLKVTNKYWKITTTGDLIYTDGVKEFKKFFASKT